MTDPDRQRAEDRAALTEAEWAAAAALPDEEESEEGTESGCPGPG